MVFVIGCKDEGFCRRVFMMFRPEETKVVEATHFYTIDERYGSCEKDSFSWLGHSDP